MNGAWVPVEPKQTRKTYVLDTSVLLADPAALNRFDEHEIVLPIVVISELESKRDHPELGYFARNALRTLDELRVEHGRLDAPMALNENGGTLTVELNHSETTGLPASFFRDGTNDSRVLAVARNLKHEGKNVILVTKDLPLRVKASAVGIDAEEYRAELAVSSGWTGIVELALASEQVDQLYQSERVESLEVSNLPVHTGVVIHSNKGSALARVTQDKKLKLVRGDREVFGLHGRSAEQRIALDLLLDNEIGILSLGGRAGTGKSALAICAGLEAVMERRLHKKIVVF